MLVLTLTYFDKIVAIIFLCNSVMFEIVIKHNAFYVLFLSVNLNSHRNEIENKCIRNQQIEKKIS